MSDPLDTIRSQIQSPANAIRWACLLEAVTPKAGNVFPGRRFHDLAFTDFVVAADIASKHLGNPKSVVSERMLSAAKETRSLTGTNVNLGIILLLGPLVAADESICVCESAQQNPSRRTDVTWSDAITTVLQHLTTVDGNNIFFDDSSGKCWRLGRSRRDGCE